MPTFTGQVRKRRTSRRVAIFDRLARWTITFGGIATILSVALVCLFLFWVALPLLQGGDIAAVGNAAVPSVQRASEPRIVHLAEDEYPETAVVVGADGTAVAFAAATGREIHREALFAAAEVGCVVSRGDRMLLGRTDGKLAFVEIEFSADVLDAAAVPPAARDLAIGDSLVDAGSLIQRTHPEQYRCQRLRITRDEPLALGTDAPIVRADFSVTSRGLVLAALTADGNLHFKVSRTRHDMMADREIVTLSGAQRPLQEIATARGTLAPTTLPDHLLLAGAADVVLLLWNDGRLLRIDARDVDAPKLAEDLDLLPGALQVTSVAFLIGKTTLLIGDERGVVHCWFGTKPAAATTVDGVHFVEAREFADGPNSPVVAITASRRSRLFAIAHATGTVRVLQATSGRVVATARTQAGQPPERLVLSPKEDGVAMIAGGRLHRFDLRPGHPEVSMASSFLPVWYEGAAGPEHTWQSTSGNDDFEPKLGLWVLIFGTLKSTFYCLLFGVPLALLGAIYTSEFLHPRWRARIKPSIELMASLPSVVLGFLAALVFGPVVAQYLVSVLCAMFTVPLAFLFGAQLWQMMPQHLRPRAENHRLLAACVALPLGLWLAAGLGPLVELLLFGNDFKDWLALGSHPDAAQRGSAFGGWLLSLLPVAAFAAWLSVGRLFGGLAGRAAGMWRFVIGITVTVALAAGGSVALSALGCDLRGSLFGTFDPRNSLVVGIVMGFAVVPIIYTLAEDALSAVPSHLRAASLGAGATQWQTAVRIVLPTALSGVFSAVMVGFGRAVGETMIVVMATGSTPVLDLNVFNGFRTLSANIAIELPEAVRDSTHYRMLYLAALCLFVLTFFLNTIAEVVRQRFRKRAFQL